MSVVRLAAGPLAVLSFLRSLLLAVLAKYTYMIACRRTIVHTYSQTSCIMIHHAENNQENIDTYNNLPTIVIHPDKSTVIHSNTYSSAHAPAAAAPTLPLSLSFNPADSSAASPSPSWCQSYRPVPRYPRASGFVPRFRGVSPLPCLSAFGGVC